MSAYVDGRLVATKTLTQREAVQIARDLLGAVQHGSEYTRK